MIKLRNIRQSLWHADSKNTAKILIGFQRKISQTWAWSFACAAHSGQQMVRDQDLVPSRLRTFDFQHWNQSLQLVPRRKWRLVCEWVCTVTSVSVRIEKRTNCAKNNKPKSGGLFLVKTRPFPEHSSSIATFSAGRPGSRLSFRTPSDWFHLLLIQKIIELPWKRAYPTIVHVWASGTST